MLKTPSAPIASVGDRGSGTALRAAPIRERQAGQRQDKRRNRHRGGHRPDGADFPCCGAGDSRPFHRRRPPRARTPAPIRNGRPLALPATRRRRRRRRSRSPRPKAPSHVQRSRDPRKRPNRNTKIGWAPIISAMSALVVNVAALPSKMKGRPARSARARGDCPTALGVIPARSCRRARSKQHRGRRDANPGEREAERVEGARGDLDEKKGRAPEK